MSISINTAIRQYLSSTCNQFNEDLVAWFLQHKPEWQGNIRKDIGEPMVRERPGKRPFKYRTHDGIDFWNIRWPHNAMDNPEWDDEPGCRFPFEVYLFEVGTTGFTQSGNLQWVFDIDSVFGHGKGLSDDRIAEIDKAIEPIDYAAIRRSTRGLQSKGRHLYIRASGIQLANHTEHAALGRAQLGQLCLDAGLDFSGDVDVCGGNAWFHSRRATLENRGYELLKPALRDLTADELPSNWRDHLDVVTKKRNRVRVLGGDDNQCAEWSQNVAMDDEHKRFFDAYKETGYVLVYNPDLKMWQGHTAALKIVHKKLNLKGFFDTDTDDTDPTTPNCYFFLRPNGALFVVRLNSQKEHWSWGHTDTEKKEACCMFNAPIDLRTACRAVDGVWGGDFCTCHTQERATKLAQLFNYKLPPLENDRPINFKYADGHTIVAETSQVKGEAANGWANGYRKLATTFEVETQPIKNNYDAYARHLINTDRHNAGWMYRTTSGDWAWDQKDTVGDRLCAKFGIPAKMLRYVMGDIAATPYTLVNEPYQPEFLPGHKMNQFGAQFAIVPTHGGIHPHYDKILKHIGQGLDKAVQENEWCQQYGITTGYDFLLLWCALVVKDPKQHLPMLYLFSRARDNGKSVLHKGMGLLFFRGYVSGVLAMNEKFNKLLAGATLVYLDEERVSAASAQKVKLYIDADNIEMRLMRTDPFMFDNFTHWIAAYNFTDGVYVEDGDERIIMVEVPTLYEEDKLDWKTIMRPALESERAEFLGTLMDVDLPPSGGRLYLPVLSTELKETVMAANRTSPPCDRKELLDRVVEKIKKQFRGPSKDLVALLGPGSWDHSRNHLRRYLREIEPELNKNKIRADLSDTRLIVLELAV